MSVESSLEAFKTGDGTPSLCLHQLHILASLEDGRSILDQISKYGMYSKMQECVGNLKRCCSTCKLDEMEDMMLEMFRLHHGIISECNLSYFLWDMGHDINETYDQIKDLMVYYLSDKLMTLDDLDDGLELDTETVEKLRQGKDTIDGSLSLYALSKYKRFKQTQLNTMMKAETIAEHVYDKIMKLAGQSRIFGGCKTIIKHLAEDFEHVKDHFHESDEVEPEPVLIPLSLKPRFTYTRGELEYLRQYIDVMVEEGKENITDTPIYQQVRRDLCDSLIIGYDDYVLSKRKYDHEHVN